VFASQIAPERTKALATSALPGAPVIEAPPEKLPGRARITISVLLRNAANAFAEERQVLAAR
jgi:hypothetical protein